MRADRIKMSFTYKYSLLKSILLYCIMFQHNLSQCLYTLPAMLKGPMPHSNNLFLLSRKSSTACVSTNGYQKCFVSVLGINESQMERDQASRGMLKQLKAKIIDGSHSNEIV